MEKVKRSCLATTYFAVFLFALTLLSACNKIYYFEKSGIYISQSPYMELDCVKGTGTMIIGDVSYPLDLAFDSAGGHILIFCEENADAEILDTIREDDVYGEALIWKANTKEKNGKLYLTVTKDNISDYVGKTIVLEFQPYE